MYLGWVTCVGAHPSALRLGNGSHMLLIKVRFSSLFCGLPLAHSIMPRTSTKQQRRTNAEPRVGRPATHLQPPKKKRNIEELVLCPHCAKFVTRQTVWRHEKGKNIGIAAQVSHLASSAAQATRSAWHALRSKTSSPMNTSPASQQSSRFGAGNNEASPRSISSRVFQRLATLLPGKSGSNSGSSSHAASSGDCGLVDADAAIDFDESRASHESNTQTMSPLVEQWASNHRRATVEDADDDDDDDVEMRSDDFHPFADDWVNGDHALEDWENDWEAEDYVEAEIERQLAELGEMLLLAFI